MWDRLKYYLNPFDARFEDMTRANWPLIVLRDTSAGFCEALGILLIAFSLLG